MTFRSSARAAIHCVVQVCVTGQWAGLQSTPPPCTAGMEVAAYLSDKAASISCIDIAAVPFERVLGARIGRVLQGVSVCAWLCPVVLFWYGFT